MPSVTNLSAIQEHVYFLLNEVETHCQLVTQFYTSCSTDVLPRIRSRRGYVQTLREKIDLEAAGLLQRRKAKGRFYSRVSAMRSLAVALDSLTQYCFDCVLEGTLDKPYEHPSATACIKLMKKVKRSLDLVKFGLEQEPRRTGIKLGRRIQKLLANYAALQADTLKVKLTLGDDELRASILSNVCLKRLIEQLSVVADALIKSDLGQVASLQNYPHLLDSAANLNYDLSDLKVRRLALTRSGSAIAAISHKDQSGQEVLAVYKEGERSKIEEEVAGVNHWREIDPKLAPCVLAQANEVGEQSSLLIEHIPGKTLEALLLGEDESALSEALKKLFKTLNQTWKATLTRETCSAQFMMQLSKRIGDSRKVHPEFFKQETRICQHVLPSFDALVADVALLEQDWRAPFCVLTHGDFNVDNLIYDGLEKRIYFIDLHRASYFDYVQDLSVLMVSIYRLQVLSGATRKRMMESAKEVYRFGRRFAKQQHDDTFEVRMAAGLARSFATSTRFIFDKKLATRMHLRSRYLLEKLARLTPEDAEKFTLPLKDLYFE
ncbi:phosphotransferase [Marinomonas posidonica]|uniref:Aminoglycoside phosphotransferase n=1 Tax=Marinomonas posidonica (strain CECT 7376 / NCIMB 14433 / IVIA-Po-181) TaxID=491952 RepID=F6CWD6_MARPP|nr:phosphotransferase [Marinomonas posidonica]AEF53191.1 aminoglycoside phosphotransferase [Marinomonas posidonica IVIA-Po-181]